MANFSAVMFIEYTYWAICTQNKPMIQDITNKISNYIETATRLHNIIKGRPFIRRPDIFKFQKISSVLTNRISSMNRLITTIRGDPELNRYNKSFHEFSNYMGLDLELTFDMEFNLEPLMQLTKYALESHNKELSSVMRKEFNQIHTWLEILSPELRNYVTIEPHLSKNVADNVDTQITLVRLLYFLIAHAFVGPISDLHEQFREMASILPVGWSSLYDSSVKCMSITTAI
jgi:hypothetical protein